MEHTVISEIATAVRALDNCIKSGNTEWAYRWDQYLSAIEREYLPSGSGFDSGCTVDVEHSNARSIVINAPFHVMNNHGYYTGWRPIRVRVTPTFDGIAIRVTNAKSSDLADYVFDVFDVALTRVVDADWRVTMLKGE